MNGEILVNEAVITVKVPGYMTTEEAAKFLNISAGRVRQLVSEGVLPKEKVGNTNIIPINALKAYAENRPHAGWPKGKSRKS